MAARLKTVNLFAIVSGKQAELVCRDERRSAMRVTLEAASSVGEGGKPVINGYDSVLITDSDKTLFSLVIPVKSNDDGTECDVLVHLWGQGVQQRWTVIREKTSFGTRVSVKDIKSDEVLFIA